MFIHQSFLSQIAQASSGFIATPAQGNTSIPQQYVPSNLIDSIVHVIQSSIGGLPISTYIAWWLATYVAAAFIAMQIRGALMNDWTSVRSWPDQIVVVVRSTAQEPPGNKIERATHGAIDIYKGHVLLEWPDGAAAALIDLNKASMTVAEWGALYQKATLSLCSLLGFLTVFIVHSGMLGLLLAVDHPRLWDKEYVPQMQHWMDLIIIWPILLYFLQHTLFPDWRRQLNGLQLSMNKLSQQFGFITTEYRK